MIIPVYNRRDMLRRSIESVLSQTWKNLEIIVVDDGSTDGSADVAEQFGPPVRVLREPHRSVYVARNAGISAANGSLIAFNDSDDLWTPRRLELQIPLFERPDVGVVYGDAAYLDLRGSQPALMKRTFFESQTIPFRGRVTAHFTFGNFVGLAGVTVRRECFDTCGLFETTPPLSSDYLQWFRISRRYAFDYVDEPVYLYSIHTDRLTADLGSSLEARLIHFARELNRSPEEAGTLAHILFNLTLHYRIWGSRGGNAPRVASFLGDLRREGLIPEDVFDRHRSKWTVGFLLHQARLRPRRLIPWPSSKLARVGEIPSG